MILLGVLWPVLSMILMVWSIRSAKRITKVFFSLAFLLLIACAVASSLRLPFFIGTITLILLGYLPIHFRRRVLQEIKAVYRPRRSEVWNLAKEASEDAKRIEQACHHLEEKIDVLNRRYELAKHLVAHFDEEEILSYFGELITSRPYVPAAAILKRRTAGPAPHRIWGSRPAEAWLQIAKACSHALFSTQATVISADPYFRSTEKLIFWPIHWGGKVQAYITVAVDESVVESVKEELGVYAQILGLGLRRAELYSLVVERSRHDGLTGLDLRRVFLERVEEEILLSKRYKTSFSVMLLDLDHFKTVNDTYGHPIGDQVLQETARRIRQAVNPGVKIARYGGEEFAVLMGLSPRQEVITQAEAIRSQFEAKSFHIGGFFPIKLTVSIGVAHFLPDSPSAEVLIRRADEALYRAKEAGRNKVKEWRK